MNKDKALDLALEALEWTVEQGGGPACEHEASVCFCKENNAIAAIKQARLAPVQEPVAWQYRDANDDGTWSAWLGCDKRLTESTWREVRPLYTTPHAQPAPVQELIADPFTYIIQHLNSNPYSLTKNECIDLIKKLRDSYTNPPAAPVQNRSALTLDRPMTFGGCPFCGSQSCVAGQCRSATPPAAQRQWVGLTDEEIGSAYEEAAAKINYCAPSHVQISRAIEAKLKEKNT